MNHVEPESLAYGKQSRVASLNLRSFKGEQAEVNRKLLVDIMARNDYDILLLKETNMNRNFVEDVYGYKFFVSNDVKTRGSCNAEKIR